MAPKKLTEQEAAHAASIADTVVTLAPIPPLFKPKILVAAVIRKPAVVIEAFLKTLAWQRLRKPADLCYAFVTDFPEGDPEAAAVKKLLTDFGKSRPNVTIRHNVAPPNDYGEANGTRAWTPSAWHRVGALKNQLFQHALDSRADACWLVDADVLCDPTTLQSLLDAERPIVAAVYWTHWQRPQPGDTVAVHAGPQVWLRHPYILSGHGYSEAEFREALVERQLLRVWGLGACTLFSRAALEKGVSFTPVPEGLPPGPMSDGEDRHLCERARRLHVPLYADSWPDIYHAYHPAEYGDIARWVARFEAPRPLKAGPSDLVSFKIEPLEPVPIPNNPALIQHAIPQHVRGRLGQLHVMPEIAEALCTMTAGERRLVTLHFPIHYPYATLRNQRRLVALTLFDVKPFNLAPVVGEEIFTGAASWRMIDAVTLSPEQVVSVEEEAHAITNV